MPASPALITVRIRHKALHSVSGVGVLCVGLISVLLACIGFGKFYYPRIWDSSSLSSPSSSQQSPSMYQSSSQHFWNLPVPCDQRFEFTLALNIFLPLLSLIPLILTFPTMIAIKATSILGAALFPHFFIKVKKAIGQWWINNTHTHSHNKPNLNHLSDWLVEWQTDWPTPIWSKHLQAKLYIS